MRSGMRGAFLLAATVLWCGQALAGSWISGAKDGVAIQGYDPVAYFVQKEAVRGKVDWNHQYAGTVWYFSSDDNRKAFAAEPEKYVPQYGGHCALSMANGRASRGSGDAWYVTDGKLYLNGNQEARTRWMRRMGRNIRDADMEWPRIRAGLEAE